MIGKLRIKLIIASMCSLLIVLARHPELQEADL